MQDYYIATLIKSGMKGKQLLLAIKQNIETKCGDCVSFSSLDSQRARDAAALYYHYRQIILQYGEQKLYEDIMRAYDAKTNSRLFGRADVRRRMRGGQSE